MFDYLGVLISVILGLALTHLLLGTSRLIQERDSVKPYWVQLVWTLNVAGLATANRRVHAALCLIWRD